MDDLIEKGLQARLAKYFNPAGFFDKVVALSPFESKRRAVEGMEVIPTRDHELPARLKRVGADVVRAYGGNTPADMAVYYRAARVPVIVSIHDKRPEMIYPGVVHADIIFTVSDEIRAILQSKGVRAERIMVVPNGVDGDLMRQVPPEKCADLFKRYPFKHKILHVGRKSVEKNIEGIVHVISRLGPDYGLVAIGQGEASFYEALAQAEGVAERCVFLPGMPQQDIVPFYSWADCVCHPSRSEAMCNVLLEGLACGRPVVSTVTAAAGLGEGPARAMRLVADPEDIDALAAAVRDVCANPAAREALCSAARASVEPLFWEKAQAHEAACYRRVLDMQAKGVFARSLFDEVKLYQANGFRRIRRCLRIKP